MKTQRWIAILTLFTGLLAGCESADDGEGTLGVAVWGEEFIESGIPAGEFADGWSVTFDRFLINLADISVAEDGAEPPLIAAPAQVWDLALTDGAEAIAQTNAAAGSYSHAAYTIAPADASSTAGNADDGSLQLMRDHSYSVYAEGTATKENTTKSFAWGFTTATTYDPCESTAQLNADDIATVQITIHGDHLFYDDAVSEDPALRFEDIALADSNSDDQVSQEELQAYSLLTFPNYGVGSLDIDNLWDFISHMTSTLGHIDGEGHCGI